MDKRKTTKPSSGVSRRKVLEGAAATAAMVSAGILAACNTEEKKAAQSEAQKGAMPVVKKPFCYGPADSNHQPLNEDTTKTIYPLLAVWLLMTTANPIKYPFQPADITAISTSVGLDEDCVGKILKKYDANFANVRAAFSQIIIQFSPGSIQPPTTPPYSGGDCPKSPAVIYPVAGLMP
jgi:hypothetical protein